jgi:single-strand DNA-binding protein
MSSITIVGNITGDPETQVLPSGIPLVKFQLAETARVRQGDGSYKDGETTFWPVCVWRDMGERVAESFGRGTRVIVVGRTRINRWESQDGAKHERIVIDADEVGASCKFAAVSVRKMARGGVAGGSEGDPWATGGSEQEPSF